MNGKDSVHVNTGRGGEKKHMTNMNRKKPLQQLGVC